MTENNCCCRTKERSEKEFKECIIANLNESYVVINITDRPSDDPEEKQKSKQDLSIHSAVFTEMSLIATQKYLFQTNF